MHSTCLHALKGLGHKADNLPSSIMPGYLCVVLPSCLHDVVLDVGSETFVPGWCMFNKVKTTIKYYFLLGSTENFMLHQHTFLFMNLINVS
jgi:hypothetical protein